MNKTTYFHHILIIACIVSLINFSTPTISMAQLTPINEEETSDTVEETLKVTEALKELLASMNLGNFSYQSEDRADPFEPFISDKVVQTAIQIKPEILTGMRQFEPGQLSLVVIMFTENSPMAMVEDSSHKGYIVRKGTKIGRSGIISDILPNEVIIKQLSYSVAKEKRYKTVKMTLRQEGEK